MDEHSAIDVSALIERRGLGGYQLLVIGLCTFVLMVEGFDAQAISYAAPALLKLFHAQRAQLGPVFGAGLFGLLLGSLTVSPLADRFGRKPVVIASVLVFGVCSFMTVTADSLHGVLWWRLATGFGLGGAIPNAIALASDYCPRRVRGTTVMIVSLGVALGGGLSGPLAAKIIPAYGWTSVFYIGAALPLLLVPVLILFLPESVRLMVLHGDRDDKVARILTKIEPTLKVSPNAKFTIPEPQLPGVPVYHLFTEGRAIPTLLLWSNYFLVFLIMFSLNVWLPTVITSAGHSLADAVMATSLYSIGGVVGGVSLGPLVDRFGNRFLALLFLLSAPFIIAIGVLASGPVWIVMTMTFAAGFCLLAAEVGVNGFTTNYYPTAIRSTGLGWAGGIGRLGAAIGPITAGVLMSWEWSTQSMLLAGAIPVVIAAAAIGVIPKGSRQPSSGLQQVGTSIGAAGV